MNVCEHDEIVMTPTPTVGEVFDLQVEGNSNFFIETEPGTFLLTHNTLLKPVENPPKTTMWIFSSMEPDKFSTTAGGRALANRCIQFNLEKPSLEELRKQAIRIIKGEKLSFMTKEAVSRLVESCNQEMRTLANLIQQASLYYSGLEDPPEKLSTDDIGSVLATTQVQDEVVVVRFLTALYSGKIVAALKEIPNIADVFQFVNRCVSFNKTVLLDYVLKGSRHPKVWNNKHTYALRKNINEVLTGKSDGEILALLASVQDELLVVKQQMAMVVDFELLIALAYRVTRRSR